MMKRLLSASTALSLSLWQVAPALAGHNEPVQPVQLPAFTGGDIACPSGSVVCTIQPSTVTAGKMATGAAAGNLGSAGGDLTGTFPAPTVNTVKGKTVLPIDGSVPMQGPLTIPALAGQLYTSTAGQIGAAGCVSAEAYGASTALADNTSALLAAVAALPVMTGGCVSFGHGVYNFSQEVDVNMPNAPYSVLLKGAGETMTKLNWTGSTNGLVIAQTSQYNTSHVRDLSITTATNGGYVGLTYKTSANLGILAISDVQNVTFKGADGGKSKNYWGMGFKAHGTSYVNLISDTWIGGETGTSGVGDFLGGGVTFEGGDASGQYNIVDNIWGGNFQDLATMLTYGPYVQGVTVDQTNFQNGGLAITSVASTGSALTQLAVTNSQFGNLSTGIYKPDPNANGTGRISQMLFSNNLIFVSTGTTGLDFTTVGSYFTQIVGNTFSGNTSNGTVNAIVMGANNSSNAIIANNIFSTFTTAVNLLSNSSQTWVSGNAFYSVTNPVVDNGIRNHVDYTSNDGVRRIADDLTLQNHLNVSQSSARPTVSCAGATGASIDGNASDSAGQINVNGTTTGCTITFAGTGNGNRGSAGFVNTPRCVVSSSSGGSAPAYQVSSTQLAVQPGSGVSNPVFTYICVGP